MNIHKIAPIRTIGKSFSFDSTVDTREVLFGDNRHRESERRVAQL